MKKNISTSVIYGLLCDLNGQFNKENLPEMFQHDPFKYAMGDIHQLRGLLTYLKYFYFTIRFWILYCMGRFFFRRKKACFLRKYSRSLKKIEKFLFAFSQIYIINRYRIFYTEMYYWKKQLITKI